MGAAVLEVVENNLLPVRERRQQLLEVGHSLRRQAALPVRQPLPGVPLIRSLIDGIDRLLDLMYLGEQRKTNVECLKPLLMVVR